MAQYADIVEIVVPAQAAPGDRVDITVRVRNTYSDPIAMMVNPNTVHLMMLMPRVRHGCGPHWTRIG